MEHTLSLTEGNESVTLRIGGVTGVTVLLNREAQVSLEKGKIVCRGGGITANKLDVSSGTLELTADFINSIQYGSCGKTKPTLKNIFK